MFKFLSSMRFAFWSLISITVWFILGIFLAINDGFYYGIKAMSNMLILDWVLQKSIDFPLVLVWFIGLCIIAILLALSFLFCTCNNLLKVSLKSKSFKSILLLIIHVLFVIIMALHLGSMLWGFKYSDIEMEVGQEFKFDEGYSLILDTVKYVDDINVLKMKYKTMRKYHTRDGFHYKDNYAEFTLKQNDKIIISDQVKMLSPMKHHFIRVTISYFYLPKNTETEIPGVKVVITKNYFNTLFFIFYALEILSIIGFLIITWKKK